MEPRLAFIAARAALRCPSCIDIQLGPLAPLALAIRSSARSPRLSDVKHPTDNVQTRPGQWGGWQDSTNL
jgi:hypothetical protein